ncbi:MAG: hypothetical protein Roseis2KO_07190 [Roseivirga sp.]
MNNTNRVEKPKKKPIFTAFTVKDRRGRKIWRSEGAAFSHKEPSNEDSSHGLEVLEGLTLIVDLFGREVEFILLPYKEPEGNETENAQLKITGEVPVIQ